jgi:isopenicillin-N N-acyltransferase-like protein
MTMNTMLSPHGRLRLQAALAVVVFLCGGLAAQAQSPAAGAERTFQEGRFEKGQLKYVNDVPVLTVAGTPEEIGRQKAELTGAVMQQLAGYPLQLVKLVRGETDTPKLIERGRALLENAPADYRAEVTAFGEASGIDPDVGVLANTLPDLYRGGFGCSSLLVEPARSTTGGPIFGRNLDFFTFGVLQKYGLVTVCRPEGKHAFASVGFPGLFGVLSGMNDAGLAVAVHEVYVSRDMAPMFDAGGMPYAMLFRQILEECRTVDEAEKLLRDSKRTTKLNLAVCDKTRVAVLEMTPRTVAVRYADDGILVCTNHFRTDELKMLAICRRYDKLIEAASQPKLGVKDVAAKLNEVNQGRMTVQTMIFEPAALRLRVAMGSCPSSELPLKPLDLGPLLKQAAGRRQGETGSLPGTRPRGLAGSSIEPMP